MIAWSAEQRDALPRIEVAARQNGYQDPRPVDLEELYAREPNIGPGAEAALEIPGEGIVCPFTASSPSRPRRSPRAGAGPERSGHRRSTSDGGHEIETARGPIRARHLVDAAGLRSDDVDAMLGHSGFRSTPRRRDDHLRQAGSQPPEPTCPATGPHSSRPRACLVSPTVYRDVLLGPTTDDVADRRTARPPRRIDVVDRGRRADPAGARAARGDRHLRRASSRHRAPGLSSPARRAALRLRRKDSLDRDHRFTCDRRVGPGGAGGRRPGPGLRSTADEHSDAEHRRFGTRPTRMAADRRIPTMAGSFASATVTRGEIDAALAHPDPARRPRRASAADPGTDGPVPGLLLRGRDGGRLEEGSRDR